MQVRTLQERRARARARVECSAEMQPSRMVGMLLRTQKRAGGTHGCGERERERESQVEDESWIATSSRTKNPGEATDDKEKKKKG